MGMVFARGSLWLSTLAGLCACAADVQIVETTASAVTVCYDGITQSLEDPSADANKACAAYGKTAHWRSSSNMGLSERSAHFDCVSR
jgi:hypothetical protein